MDVGAWLNELGLGQYEQMFRQNDVDIRVLPCLTMEDLKELGIVSIGHRRLILQAIADLAASRALIPLVATRAGSVPDARTEPNYAERRQLTVMFVDLVGSTELSRRLDPEEMSGVLRTFQDALAGVISCFGGFIAQYMGDGVMAYFGWPKAQEDAAERAVRAASSLSHAVGRESEPGGEALACRVGIATGLVVVGELIGTGTAQAEAVVGETPNLAARLQACAAPGEVVVAGTTRRLIGNLFDFAPVALGGLKGFEAGVKAFRVLGEGRAEGRFEALRGPTPTPLVGRKRELTILLHRWAQAKGGRGQAVQVCGEPGIGKSRIVQALRERLGTEPHIALQYQCSPHHTASALWPVIEQLRRAAGIAANEPPEANLDRLEALFGQGSSGLAAATPLIADLLGVPAGEHYPAHDLTPQRRKALTFEALLAQVEGLATERPVLMVLEDAHWLDPTSLELFGQLVARIERLPVLLVDTFRPEFRAPWTNQPHAASLTVGRLDADQARALTERVAGGRALPAEILGQILAKTDGVPLFVEELTKTVLEFGAAVGGRERLYARRAVAAARDSVDPAQFADGSARSPGSGQGGGAGRRRHWPGIRPRAARRCDCAADQ